MLVRTPTQISVTRLPLPNNRCTTDHPGLTQFQRSNDSPPNKYPYSENSPSTRTKHRTVSDGAAFVARKYDHGSYHSTKFTKTIQPESQRSRAISLSLQPRQHRSSDSISYNEDQGLHFTSNLLLTIHHAQSYGDRCRLAIAKRLSRSSP
jgi:hypothetical protein